MQFIMDWNGAVCKSAGATGNNSVAAGGYGVPWLAASNSNNNDVVVATGGRGVPPGRCCGTGSGSTCGPPCRRRPASCPCSRCTRPIPAPAHTHTRASISTGTEPLTRRILLPSVLASGGRRRPLLPSLLSLWICAIYTRRREGYFVVEKKGRIDQNWEGWLHWVASGSKAH